MAVTFSGVSGAIFRAFGMGGVGNPEQGQQVLGPTSTQSDSGLVVTDSRALQLPTAWACIRTRTLPPSSLPLDVYRRTDKGREKDESHWLNDIFKISPNAVMSPLAFRRAMQMQLVAWGNAYALIERRGEKVVALNPMLPEFMEVRRDGNEVKYTYTTSKGPKEYDQSEIFHLKGFSPDGVVGLSPLAYARHTMGISVSADKYASLAFSKGQRPPGFLSTDKTLTATQREDMKKIHQGLSVEDTGTWILEAGLDYKTISIPPDDLQMLQSRAFQVAEVCRFYGVPSYLVNDMEKSTSWGTGIEQQNIGFLQYTIGPDLNEWESAISTQLLSRTERRKYYMEHNVDGFLRADSQTRASVLSTYVQNGLMARNEGRSKLNLPPKDGGDDLTVQVNMTPVDQLPKVNGNGIQDQPN